MSGLPKTYSVTKDPQSNRITLGKPVIECLDVSPGDKVLVKERDGKVVVEYVE